MFASQSVPAWIVTDRIISCVCVRARIWKFIGERRKKCDPNIVRTLSLISVVTKQVCHHRVVIFFGFDSNGETGKPVEFNASNTTKTDNLFEDSSIDDKWCSRCYLARVPSLFRSTIKFIRPARPSPPSSHHRLWRHPTSRRRPIPNTFNFWRNWLANWVECLPRGFIRIRHHHLLPHWPTCITNEPTPAERPTTHQVNTVSHSQSFQSLPKLSAR